MNMNLGAALAAAVATALLSGCAGKTMQTGFDKTDSAPAPKARSNNIWDYVTPFHPETPGKPGEKGNRPTEPPPFVPPAKG